MSDKPTTASAPAVIAQLQGVQAIHVVPVAHLNDLGDGWRSATIAGTDGLVLSVQENGSLETRPAGSNGAFEAARLDVHGLLYRPKGTALYVVPYVVISW